MQLNNKVILIISPQAWGKMFLAKHHYAIELAKHNNEVYFLNPPQQKTINNEVEIEESNVEKSLYLINHSLKFNYKIKFKVKWLFHLLMKNHIKEIEKKINKHIDIIWSFDLGNYYPFKYFSKKSLKIFFPIDEPLNKDGIDSARGCFLIFSITKEILEKYRQYNVPKYFLHHGLSADFLNAHQQIKNDEVIRFGLSGNWLRNDLDRKILLQIIQENEQIVFELWGTYNLKDSNIGGSSDDETISFINSLKQQNNVILHGAIQPKNLSQEFRRMDGFLICYDIIKDQSKGTNYHKVIEYLSTGKVIVSNNITTYCNMKNLLVMTNNRTNNNELPSLFNQVINNLEFYNSLQLKNSRINFAHNNLYSEKINEIEQLLNKTMVQ